MSFIGPIIVAIGFFGTIITIVENIFKTKRAQIELERKRLEVRERELDLEAQKLSFLQAEDKALKEIEAPHP